MALVANIIRFIFVGENKSAIRAMRETETSAQRMSRTMKASDAEAAAANEELNASTRSLKSGVGALAGPAGFLGLGFGIGAAINAAATYQQHMTMLQTQTGASAGEVHRMTGALLGLATQVGTGPSGLAMGLYHLESANFRGAKALRILRIAAEGAQIGHANLEDVTNALNAALVAHIKGINSYSEAMGVLNATVGAGDMRMQDLADAMGHGTLAVAKNYGLTMQDVGSVLAVFGDNNIRGSNAATLLRMALSRMLPTSSTAVRAFAAVGLSQRQLADDLRRHNGVLVAVDDVNKHLKEFGLSGSARTQQIQEMFGGSRFGAGVMTLLNQRGRLAMDYHRVNDGTHKFNQEWTTFTHTLTYYMGVLRAFGEVLLIKFGGAIVAVIRVVLGFVNAVRHGRVWALALAGALGGAAAGFLLYKGYVLAAAAANALFGAGTLLRSIIMLIPEIGSLADAWAALDLVMDANPMGVIILALVALGAIFVVLWTKVKVFRDAIKAAFNWLIGAVGTVVAFLKAHWEYAVGMILMGPFGLLVAFAVTHFNQIVHFVAGMPGKIAKAAVGLWDGLKGGLIDVANWIITFINSTFGTIHLPFGLGSIHLFTIGKISTGVAKAGLSSLHPAPSAGHNAYSPNRSVSSATPRPAPSAASVGHGSGLGGLGHGPGEVGTVVVHSHTNLDSRVLAETVTHHVLKKKAMS